MHSKATFLGCVPARATGDGGPPPDSHDCDDAIKFLKRPWRISSKYRYGVPATAQISIDEAKEVVRITARTFPPAEVVKYSFDHSVAHVSGVSRRKGRLAFSVKNDGKVPGDYPPAKFDYVTYVLQCDDGEIALRFMKLLRKLVNNVSMLRYSESAASSSGQTPISPCPSNSTGASSSDLPVFAHEASSMAPDGAEMPRDGSVASASSSALNQPELEYQGGYLKAPATEGGLKFVAGDSRQQAGPLPASARIDASQPWFRGDMSKKDSRALFARDSVQPGDFLVRKSKTVEQNFTLSVMTTTQAVHYRIVQTDKGDFYVDGQDDLRFVTLNQLIVHYCASGVGPDAVLRRAAGYDVPLDIQQLAAAARLTTMASSASANSAQRRPKPTQNLDALVKNLRAEGRDKAADALEQKLAKNLGLDVAALARMQEQQRSQQSHVPKGGKDPIPEDQTHRESSPSSTGPGQAPQPGVQRKGRRKSSFRAWAAREDHLEKAADEAVFTLGEDGMEEICEWESGGSAEEGGGLVESDGEAPGAGDGEPPGAGASARTEDATPQEATSRQPVPAAGSTAQSPARFEEELEC